MREFPVTHAWNLLIDKLAPYRIFEHRAPLHYARGFESCKTGRKMLARRRMIKVNFRSVT